MFKKNHRLNPLKLNRNPVQRETSFNIMSTPALVVDGTIEISGRIPSVDELKKMIS